MQSLGATQRDALVSSKQVDGTIVLFWCGCIIENIFKRSSDQNDPHEFGVQCIFTGLNASKFEKQCR